MHVLFLYASTGSGHLKAAKYVAETIKRKNSNIQVHMSDALKLCYSAFESFILKAFRFLISGCPLTYRFLYRLTEKNSFFNYIAGLFFSSSVSELKRICNSTKADCIVCTHPFALMLASKLKKELKLNTPVIMGIITDYKLHSFWIYPQIDLYFVPSDEMKEDLLRLGWSEDRIKVTGVPCPPDIGFDVKVHRQGKPYWLVSGGGWGLGNLESTTLSLLEKQAECMLIVVTGENNELYRRLKIIEAKNPGRLIVAGTIPKLYKTMKNALAVLTKPGGLTVTEAMILRKPLILLKPLPGAEEKNLDYLVRQGAAISYSTFLKQTDIIDRWHQLHSHQQGLTAKSDSSYQIARCIIETCSNTNPVQ
jgi:processive 1,2-diacylglycerol beta-glucosyltransferase